MHHPISIYRAQTQMLSEYIAKKKKHRNWPLRSNTLQGDCIYSWNKRMSEIRTILYLFIAVCCPTCPTLQSNLIEKDLNSLQAQLMESSITDASGLSFFEHFHISPIKVRNWEMDIFHFNSFYRNVCPAFLFEAVCILMWHLSSAGRFCLQNCCLLALFHF